MNIDELTIEEIAQEISSLYKQKKYYDIKQLIVEINPTDIATLFDEFSFDQKLLLFRLLPK